MNKKHGKSYKDCKCSECKMTFTNQQSLEEHEKTHKTNDLFICEKCQEIFLKRADFDDHVKTHLICYICKRECNSLKSLNRHLATHK